MTWNALGGLAGTLGLLEVARWGRCQVGTGWGWHRAVTALRGGRGPWGGG